MKGKTTKPITILVHPDLADEFVGEQQVGHIVTIGDKMSQYDMIVGPNCWRMTKELLKHKDIAIKAARGAKK
jgi:hypothetical protein